MVLGVKRENEYENESALRSHFEHIKAALILRTRVDGKMEMGMREDSFSRLKGIKKK